MPDSLGINICGKCKDELPKDGDYAICRLCGENFHFGDCSIRQLTWKGLGKNGQEKWTCSSCRKKEKSKSQSEDVVVDNLPLDLASKIDSLMEMKDAMTRIEEAMGFQSHKYDEILNELKLLRQENKELKKELIDVRCKLVKSEEHVQLLTDRVNDMEQYGRRVNLEIHGVSVRGPNLESENINNVVRELAEEIKVPFETRTIQKMHRLQKRSDGRPPAILIQFMTVTTRDEWLRAGKKARLSESGTNSKIFFNENLTFFNKGLLRETKTRAKMHNYKFVWFQNGKVLVKKDQDDRNTVVIKRMEDINKIGK